MEAFGFLAPAWIVIKYIAFFCVPILGWLCNWLFGKLKDHERNVEKLKDETFKLEKELNKEATELRERIIKLESTAVTTEQQRQMLREYSADMEERFEGKINDLKEFMKELFSQLSKK